MMFEFSYIWQVQGLHVIHRDLKKSDKVFAKRWFISVLPNFCHSICQLFKQSSCWISFPMTILFNLLTYDKCMGLAWTLLNMTSGNDVWIFWHMRSAWASCYSQGFEKERQSFCETLIHFHFAKFLSLNMWTF
jgi:hypothetical protein